MWQSSWKCIVQKYVTCENTFLQSIKGEIELFILKPGRGRTFWNPHSFIDLPFTIGQDYSNKEWSLWSEIEKCSKYMLTKHSPLRTLVPHAEIVHFQIFIMKLLLEMQILFYFFVELQA